MAPDDDTIELKLGLSVSDMRRVVLAGAQARIHEVLDRAGREIEAILAELPPDPGGYDPRPRPQRRRNR